jgi:hypothetical protein
VYLENIIKYYEKPAGKLPVNVFGVANTDSVPKSSDGRKMKNH